MTRSSALPESEPVWVKCLRFSPSTHSLHLLSDRRWKQNDNIAVKECQFFPEYLPSCNEFWSFLFVGGLRMSSIEDAKIAKLFRSVVFVQDWGCRKWIVEGPGCRPRQSNRLCTVMNLSTWVCRECSLATQRRFVFGVELTDWNTTAAAALCKTAWLANRGFFTQTILSDLISVYSQFNTANMRYQSCRFYSPLTV